ncbi:MAG: cysteine protease StiP domain-containing protein [Sarcina sp.]
MNLLQGSYNSDCKFLLKDLSGFLEEISIEEKEKRIASGISYSNFISKEIDLGKEIDDLFLEILKNKKKLIARYVAIVAEQIYLDKGKNLVIVSLARAGTPYGILMRRYLKFKYNVDIKHYSISIIRGKGIDFNALKYIIKHNENCNIQFVDGWTGKGSIINELQKSIFKFNKDFNYSIDYSLAVIADPAKVSKYYGTRKDIAVPNSILNSTVSGLISRTVLNPNFIKDDDFHGAININYFAHDYSNIYVDEISKEFSLLNYSSVYKEKTQIDYAKNIVNDIKHRYEVEDINKIKLSIGEASRVLLRRKARVLLLKDKKDEEVRQLLILAEKKGVPIEEYKNSEYRAIAIIE